MSKRGAQVRLGAGKDPCCPKHSTVEATFVCLANGCEETLACNECIVGDHNTHKMTLLRDHIGVFKKRISDYNMKTTEKVLSHLKKELKKVADDLSAFDPSTAVLLNEIEARGEKIKGSTDKLVIEFKTKCNQTRASNRQAMEHYQRRLLAKITEVETDISVLDKCLMAECKADIVKAANTGISKKYSDLLYPEDIKEVSFKGSDAPLKDVAKLLGQIRIGNEQQAWEESGDEKIKRLESHIKDMKQQERADQTRVQTLQAKKDADANQMKIMQDTINDLKRQLEQSRTAMQGGNARSSQQRNPKPQPTDDCQTCRQPKRSCECRTCPICHYKGDDFKCEWKCPKCRHPFYA